ncbi:MAG: AmmeMemoRadiSam system protein B [Planctomycetes bacterium]|nr:AmmeMemoRadiSam system protein B [Planctomycetota bacterium]
MIRSPIVAGTFYDASPQACERMVRSMLAATHLPESTPTGCVGGLVPHAGWVCSGTVAALTFLALVRDAAESSFVLLGASHAPTGRSGLLFDQGTWETPLGEVAVDGELAAAVARGCPGVQVDCRAHGREHSLEVQLPFIQVLRPNARIVPILAPPVAEAAEMGRQIGAVLAGWTPRPVVIGSTDLTHYGPRYGVTPAGVGMQGIEWAMANDRELLKLIEAMDAVPVVEHTRRTHSACGGGAIAATMTACQALGATSATVLQHTNSYETLKAYSPNDTSHAVGYTSVVFA